ncbi:serine dehydratase subunit alpha family protein [Mycoplasma sp. P36-A1]|uniref:L-cysteine desulfidase family protein n=1 Tax=Mycoplasma sp. P36-A1 TaxID=3252900 RepID=UPI003C307053
MFKQENYNAYLQILKEELVPALGCTEPIAVAFGAALARKYLESFPTEMTIKSSGNIIKNAKSVVVPNTGGLKGMQASMLAGLVGGEPDLGLEVLSKMTEENIKEVNELMNTGLINVEKLDTPTTLHMIISASDGTNNVEVEIKHMHTNVVRITLNGKDIVKQDVDDAAFASSMTDRSILTVDQILDFVEIAKYDDYKDLLELQMANNIAIGEEGLTNDYGVSVGKTLIKYGDNNIETKVKAMTAAGSDARMAGSTMPVVTNSGSGNQGMTCSIPVIVYAKENGYDHAKMMKALLLSNLITIHVKTGITRLSCYCGAVVAASGSAAGIMYLDGGSREQIKKAITNVLGNVSGIICDGAKESCPSKISSALDAAFQAVNLAKDNLVFTHGCGIVEDDIEHTIKNVGILGKVGMKETDAVILDIMTGIEN